MSGRFQAHVEHRADLCVVKLGGVIDEDNQLAELIDRVPRGTAIIELGEVERINSCGVRDWVNWLGRLEAKGVRPVFSDCSPAIVAQINLVNNFTGNGVVKSFYVPYFCAECDEEKVMLVETAEMGPPPHEPPVCRCDECDLVMEFDDLPESYFAFLSNQRKLGDLSALPAPRSKTPRPVSSPLRASTPVIEVAPARPSMPSLAANAASSQPFPAQAPVEPPRPKSRTAPPLAVPAQMAPVSGAPRPKSRTAPPLAPTPPPANGASSLGASVNGSSSIPTAGLTRGAVRVSQLHPVGVRTHPSTTTMSKARIIGLLALLAIVAFVVAVLVIR